jgi:polysaccharide pyruvyl transferase WcaK-like protein
MRLRRRRVVLIGDIGGAATYHVGDEAMFEADLDLVRRILPTAQCTALSSDPSFTASTFGIDVLPRLSPPEVRELPRAHVPPALAAAADADLLVLTGGGNLNSSFPLLIAERLALARATARAGGAVAVLGQTLGPALTPADAARVSELLGLACYVGLRDATSVAVARELGIDASVVVEQLDDAWAMDEVPAARAPEGMERPVIALTLHPDPRIAPPRAIRALADQLTQVVGHLGGSVVLVPHSRAPEGPGGSSDEVVADGLAEQLATRSVPVTSVGVLTPREVVAVTRTADLVISSRHHPLVFAQRGAVPALALWADPYVRAKQVGAMAHAGLQRWALPLDEAMRGLLVPAAIELQTRHEELRSWLVSIRPSLEARVAARDTQLAAKLREAGLDARAPTAGTRLVAAPSVPAPVPAGGWDGAGEPVPRPVPDPLLEEFFALRAYARSLEVERDAMRSAASGAGDDQHAPRLRATRLDSVRLEIDSNRIALVGTVAAPGLDPTDIRFRVYAPRMTAHIDASATPMLPVVTMLAARLGTDLVVDAPVDECALDNARRAAAVLEAWWGWRQPRISGMTPMPAVAPAPGVGLWFSRGVDSTDTLLRALAGEPVVDGRPVQLTHLLGLDWIDPPYAVLSAVDVWSDTEDAAGSIGLPLVRFTTDVRRVLEPFLPWEQTHGAVFAGLGLLVGPALGTVLLSGCAAASAAPFGSHPVLDPLWSSSGTTIEHVGDDVTRATKVARIAGDPGAMRRLKVCWKADTLRNCGRCSKCLITLTMLRVIGEGAGAESPPFDAPLSAESVRALARSPGRLTTLPATVDDILRLLPAEELELRAAWEEVRARLRDDAAAAS